MGVAKLTDTVIPHPGIGDDCRAGFDVVGDERMQRGSRGIGQNANPNPSVATRLVNLNRNANKGFLTPSPAAGQSGLLAADVGLVDLHGASQAASSGAHAY